MYSEMKNNLCDRFCASNNIFNRSYNTSILLCAFHLNIYIYIINLFTDTGRRGSCHTSNLYFGHKQIICREVPYFGIIHESFRFFLIFKDIINPYSCLLKNAYFLIKTTMDK